MTKTQRQDMIMSLIKNREIETQEELAKALSEEGAIVTQATVSRDIRELGLTKLPPGEGKQRYVPSFAPEHAGELSEKYVRVLKEAMMSVDNAQNLLVIKTVSGMAMAVAAAIDSMHLSEVVGSIAGDDTIMVAVKSTEEAVLLKKKLASRFL